MSLAADKMAVYLRKQCISIKKDSTIPHSQKLQSLQLAHFLHIWKQDPGMNLCPETNYLDWVRWGTSSSGMWHWIIGYLIPCVSRQESGLMVKGHKVLITLTTIMSFLHSSPSEAWLHHILIQVTSPITSSSRLYFGVPTFLFPLIFTYSSLLKISSYAINFGSLYNVHNSKAHLLLQMPPSFIRPNIIHNTILWNTSRFGSSNWKRVQHSVPYIITGKFLRLSGILSASVGQNNSCMAMIQVFISACHKIGHFFILHPCYS